jgi:hypothetical protein
MITYHFYNSTKIFSQFAIVCLLFFVLLCQFNCSKKSTEDDVILAKVGDEVITVKDFRYNYEFGLPILKTGADPKKTYLDYMIKEKILAKHGKKMGLAKSDRVSQLVNELKDELLVEEIFKKEVHEKINITPDEIKDAITKSKVSWKLRYWAEPNPEYAENISRAMRARGYSSVVDDILNSNPEIKLKPKDFDTDYITWLEVSPELLEKIKDLPVGEISDPVELNGMFFIFQIVDIRREPLSDYEINNKSKTFEKILFARKVQDKATQFVSEFMTPKNVVTKGESFRKIAKAMEEWDEINIEERGEFLETVLSAEEDDNALFELRNNLDKTLVTFEKNKWTVEDFLKRFREKSLKFPSQDGKNFRSQLNQQIALTVRDHFFIKEAKKRKLDTSKPVQKELIQWRNKWVYEEMRGQLSADLNITDEQARNYFNKYKDKYKIRWDDKPQYGSFKNQAKRDVYIQNAKMILNQKVDSLKTIYPVSIDYAVLDSIQVIDFKKSKWISLQVYKQSSNRMAVPIVDPAWGL